MDIPFGFILFAALIPVAVHLVPPLSRRFDQYRLERHKLAVQCERIVSRAISKHWSIRTSPFGFFVVTETRHFVAWLPTRSWLKFEQSLRNDPYLRHEVDQLLDAP